MSEKIQWKISKAVFSKKDMVDKLYVMADKILCLTDGVEDI